MPRLGIFHIRNGFKKKNDITGMWHILSSNLPATRVNTGQGKSVSVIIIADRLPNGFKVLKFFGKNSFRPQIPHLFSIGGTGAYLV